MGWIGHSLALLPCRTGKGEPSVQDSQGPALEIWGGRPGRTRGALLHLLSHLLVSSCVSVSMARLTAPLGKHSLGAPAAEPLLAHHLVCAPVGIFSLCVARQGPQHGCPPLQARSPSRSGPRPRESDLVAQLCPTLATPWTTQSVEFSRPEYWSGQPFPSPGDLLNLGIEPRSPALQADSLPAEPQGRPKNTVVGTLSFLQQIFLTQESD